jgi:hypothetical protein
MAVILRVNEIKPSQSAYFKIGLKTRRRCQKSIQANVKNSLKFA